MISFIALAVLAPSARVGHKLGDYITGQTDRQARGKAAPGYNPDDPADGKSVDYAATWRHNLGHVAAYHATLTAVVGASLAATGVRVRPSRAIAALTFSAATHALIDRRWPVELVMKWTGSEAFYPAGAPAVDQTLHDACLHLAVLWAASGFPDPLYITP
jgi:hypothetical protein